ncbi:MAG: HepT-like ribonuclease domain-containing protein [Planctomycetota bacterium]|nr:HepT-like ribonuclease domain-containing protein [Planctomycetota bacterium]
MLDACDRIARFVADRSLVEFQSDDYFRSAVERQLEIVGEAARGVSETFKNANTHIPWRPIIAQRHILAHEYGEVDPPLIWRVATTHIPALAAQLRALLGENA